MHCIACKPSHIYSMVIKDMSIESIVMPYFLIVLIFHVFFKIIKQPCIFSKIIDENSRPISKVKLRTSKKWSTYNFAFPNRRLILYIQIYCLCIPGYSIFYFFQLLYTFITFFRSRYYAGSIILFHDFQLHPL